MGGRIFKFSIQDPLHHLLNPVQSAIITLQNSTTSH